MLLCFWPLVHLLPQRPRNNHSFCLFWIMSLPPLLNKLTGGDRRQIGRSEQVATDVKLNPELFPILFSGLTCSDSLVRMRSADAAEKVTRQNTGLLKPHKSALLRILETSAEQEVCWHVAAMVPRLRLTVEERKRVFVVLKSYLTAGSRIQRVMALQGLVDLTDQGNEIRRQVVYLVKQALDSDAPSVRARARKYMRKFNL